jgi:RNA polymerase sigma-70 factor (ECF subfamily)
VTNAFLDGRRRRQTSAAEPLIDDPETSNPAPIEKMENQELGAALADAIAELPETARAVFLLRTQEQLSFREIADAVGTSEETARWHMMQARRGLMRRLDGWM